MSELCNPSEINIDECAINYLLNQHDGDVNTVTFDECLKEITKIRNQIIERNMRLIIGLVHKASLIKVINFVNLSQLIQIKISTRALLTFKAKQSYG